MEDLRLEEQLWMYVDGLLEEDQLSALEEKLDSDDALRKKLNEIILLDQSIKSHMSHSAPASIKSNVLAKLKEEQSMLSRSAWIMSMVIIGIVLMSILSVALVGGFNAQAYSDSALFEAIRPLISSPILVTFVFMVLGALLIQLRTQRPSMPR